MSKVKVNLVDSAQALAFWRAQKDASVFAHPSVLEPLCERVDWWIASSGVQALCLWPVCHAVAGGYQPPELASYVGPVWSDVMQGQKVHRQWTFTHEAYSALLPVLVERYGTFVFELPPGTRDIRNFQWFQQENQSRHAVDIECRHTALIHAAPCLTEAKIESEFSRNRVRDLKTARAGWSREWLRPDPAALFALYAGLLDGKQEIEKARRREHEVKQLIGLVSAGFGSIIAYLDSSGDPASFTLTLDTKFTSLQVLIASSELARAEGLQALVQLQAITRCFENGVTTFDFAGGNSRAGAEEKHRYGGTPEMYFRISVGAR